jgi:hypothetical protein
VLTYAASEIRVRLSARSTSRPSVGSHAYPAHPPRVSFLARMPNDNTLHTPKNKKTCPIRINTLYTLERNALTNAQYTVHMPSNKSKPYCPKRPYLDQKLNAHTVVNPNSRVEPALIPYVTTPFVTSMNGEVQ